jgi:hypothetical protein
VPTWKARELMKIALQAKECDTLVNQQAIEINKGLKYEASQDSLIVIRSRENAIIKIENKDWNDRFNNQVSLTKIEKRKKRRWMEIAGVIIVGEILVKFISN